MLPLPAARSTGAPRVAAARQAKGVPVHVKNDCVVAFHYSVSNGKGVELDSSRGHLPALYLHGRGQLVPGLERALAGRAIGDRVDVVVPPALGYGLRDPALVQVMPLALVEHAGDIQVGMQFQAQTEEGPLPVRVVNVDQDSVTVDGNHPWAGEELHFSVQIRHVRPATREELEKGEVDPD